jgi:hypothetical protein
MLHKFRFAKGGEKFAVVLMGRFCKFQKDKTAELPNANVRWRKPVKGRQILSPGK